jgi:hypothetical protein
MSGAGMNAPLTQWEQQRRAANPRAGAARAARDLRKCSVLARLTHQCQLGYRSRWLLRKCPILQLGRGCSALGIL